MKKTSQNIVKVLTSFVLTVFIGCLLLQIFAQTQKNPFEILAMDFAPDGKTLAVALNTGKIQIWQSGGVIKTLDVGNTSNIDLRFSPDNRFLAVYDGTYYHLLKTDSWEPAQKFDMREGNQESVVILINRQKAGFNQDGSLFAYITQDGLNVVETKTFQLVRKFPTKVYSFNFIGMGNRLAISGDNKGTRIFDVSTGNILKTFPNVDFSAILPDGKFAYTTNKAIFDLEAGVETMRVQATDYSADTPFFSSDGKLFALANTFYSAGLYLYDGGSRTKIYDLIKEDRKGDKIAAVVFSPNSRLLLAAQKSEVRIWNTRTGKIVSTIDTAAPQSENIAGLFAQTIFDVAAETRTNQPPKPAAVNSTLPNGKMKPEISLTVSAKSVTPRNFDQTGSLLTGVADNIVKVWDARNGFELRAFPAAKSYPVFSTDNEILITTGDGTVQFWSLTTGELRRTLPVAATISSLILSRDGKLLAAALNESQEEDVRIWKVETGEIISRIKFKSSDDSYTGGSYGSLIAFNRDATELASSSANGKVTIWNAATGVKNREFSAAGKQEFITAIAYSPDGKFLATGGQDKKVKIWDAASGKQRSTLEGHTAEIASIAFSPDATKIITVARPVLPGADFSHDVKIWSLETSKEILDLGSDMSSNAVFSPDGKLFATDGITLRDAETGKTIRNIGKQNTMPAEIGEIGNGTKFSADDKLLGGLINWRNARIAFTPIEKKSNQNISYSTDYKFAARASEDFVEIIETTSGKILYKLPFGAFRTKFSPDGKTLTLRTFDEMKGVVVIDLMTRQKRFDCTVSNVADVLVSPHNRYLLITVFMSNAQAQDKENIHQIFDLTNGKLISTFKSKYGSKWQFSSNDEKIAYNEGDLKIIEVKTGKELFAFKENFLRTFEFSPDGKTLAVQTSVLGAARVENVAVIDAATGEKILSLPGINSSPTFAPDGKTLATISEDFLKFWNIETGLEISSNAIGQAASDLSFNRDGSVLAAKTKDGLTRIWKVADGREIVGYFVDDKNSLLAVTPEGYYLAERGATDSVAFRVGKRVFPFEQFDVKYNRPDIVLGKLGAGNAERIAAYRRAYEKRLRRLNLTPEMLGDDFQIPEIGITNKIPATVFERELNFKVRATDAKYKIRRFNVFVNDVPIFGSDGLDVSASAAQMLEQNINLELSVGANRVEVSALNERGAESLREIFDVNFDPPAPRKPNLYVLAIGVSDYVNAEYRLDLPAKDATDISDLFERNAGDRYGKIFVKKILNREAVRENILAAKDWLKQAETDDETIVFVAGHGLRDKKLDYYFGTADVNFELPAERGLSYDALENLLDDIRARHKLLLMDTCFAGEIDGEVDKETTTTKVAETDAGKITSRTFERGAGNKKISANDINFALDNFFAELRRGSGAFVIAAAGGAEYALESREWNNGVFTYAVLNGLKTANADGNRDGAVSVGELRDYVADEVSRLTAGSQKPVARRDNFKYDFILAANTKVAKILKHDGGIHSLAISPDGKTLASYGGDQAVRIWNVQSGRQTNMVPSAWGAAQMQWRPNTNEILFFLFDNGEMGNYPSLLDVEKDRKERNFKSDIRGGGWNAAWNNDGKQLAFASYQKKVFIVKADSGKILKTLSPMEAAIYSVAWSADNRFVAAGDTKGNINVWQAESGNLLYSIKAYKKAIKELAFDSNATALVSVSEDGATKIWNPSDGKLVREPSPSNVKNSPVASIAINKNGTLLVTGHENGMAQIWDLKNGKLLDTVSAGVGLIIVTAFSPDNSFFVTAGADGNIKIWRNSYGK